MKAKVHWLPVERVRPEEGLGRKRSREGHKELCESIARFGVLTPIAVRPAPDGSGDYLLVKGEGRTLACRMLGLDRIPAVVVSADFTDTDKVQQFLVENVARLRMRPIERALLIAHARHSGEETVDVAKRFGITAATVRRLQTALEHATSAEIAALREGKISLALHAAVARHALPTERLDVLEVFTTAGIGARDAEKLLQALSWKMLSDRGPRTERLALLTWCCSRLGDGTAPFMTRLVELASGLPVSLPEVKMAPRTRAAAR